MAKVIQSVINAPSRIKTWKLKKKLKAVAVEYVRNSRFIKRAEELKTEQPSLKKQFEALRKELSQLEGEMSSDDDGPSEPSSYDLLNMACLA